MGNICHSFASDVFLKFPGNGEFLFVLYTIGFFLCRRFMWA